MGGRTARGWSRHGLRSFRSSLQTLGTAALCAESEKLLGMWEPCTRAAEEDPVQRAEQGSIVSQYWQTVLSPFPNPTSRSFEMIDPIQTWVPSPGRMPRGSLSAGSHERPGPQGSSVVLGVCHTSL
jgi:hypothetical protein